MTEQTIEFWKGRAETLERALDRLPAETRLRVLRQAAGSVGGAASARQRAAKSVDDNGAVEKHAEYWPGPARLAQDHVAVGYAKESGVDGEFCGGCTYYQGDRSGLTGGCSLVDGMIAQAGRCELFEPLAPMKADPATGMPVRQDATPEEEEEVEDVAKELGDLEIRFPVSKADRPDAEEKRLVTGVVLQPEIEDAQGDVVSVEEIEKAAHGFMERSRRMFLQHAARAPAVVPVESYVAPGDLTINGESVRKGSWIIVAKVGDDGIWKSVKDGSFTGFSIRGTARKQAA